MHHSVLEVTPSGRAGTFGRPHPAGESSLRARYGAGMGTKGAVSITGREEPAGLTLRTSGLSARGLPEITVTGLPPYLGRAWARILAVLAVRLAATVGPGGEVPSTVAFTPDDLQGAVGERSTGWSETVVGLRREAGHLVPVPPEGFGGTLEQWWLDLAIRLFPAARS